MIDRSSAPTGSAITSFSPFIARHMIRKAEKAFDDFAGTGADQALLHEVLGLRPA